MSDPLDVLRLPVTPVEPDPAFAARLRAQVARALYRGASVTPTYRHGDIGYAWLAVPDVDRAVAFYGAVLGWTAEPGLSPQGRQLVGRSPGLGLSGGAEHACLHCCYAVADVDAATAQVREAGGTASEPADRPYGRLSDCTDPGGTAFALYQPPEGVGDAAPPTGGHGDLVYTTFEVVDSGRARAFYGAVLGWDFTAGGVEDGWQIAGGAGGLQGGHERATTLPMWRVEDMAVTVEAVRAAGGRPGEVQSRPYGLECLCTDDQGTRFYLGQL